MNRQHASNLHEQRRRATPSHKGFTLLEIMLATLLGALLLATCLSVFTAIQRSDARNRDRMERSMELSLAQRSIELSLRTMIMSNTPPPRPVAGGTNTPTDAQGLAAGQPPAGIAPAAENPRLILGESEGSGHTMQWEDPQGRIREMSAQTLQVTLERPPVFAEPEPGEVFVPVVHRMYSSRRSHSADRSRQQRERHDRRESRAGRGTPSDVAPPGENDEETENAIAAGVRGQFELTWEVPPPRRGGHIEGVAEAEGSWTLWWRTTPPLAGPSTEPGEEEAEGLSPEELASDPMYRPVKLISNLETCRWEAVRGGETVSELEATWWEDLPAYVTLEIRTTGGQWMKWMFEVQATHGAEPGSEIGRIANQGGTAEQPLDPNDPNLDEATRRALQEMQQNPNQQGVLDSVRSTSPGTNPNTRSGTRSRLDRQTPPSRNTPPRTSTPATPGRSGR